MLEALKRLLDISTDDSGFAFRPDSSGLIFFLDQREFDLCNEGKGNPRQKLQLTLLRMLAEQGQAEEMVNGFRLMARDAAALEDEAAQLLGLPERFEGKFKAGFDGITTHSNFKPFLQVDLPDGQYPYQRKGPVFSISSTERFLLTPAQLLALEAFDHYLALSPDERGEAANLRLVASLQTAQRSGMAVDLAQFDNLDVAEPDNIGITMTRLRDGSLQLCPSLGDGSTPEELSTRWGQLEFDSQGGVIRIKNRIVILDEKQLKGITEVLGNRHIPCERVKEFLETPSAFLDASLVDLDQGFSVRVEGLGKLEHISLAQADQSQDWFNMAGGASPPDIIPALAKTEEDLTSIERSCEQAWQQGADIIHFEGESIDVSDRENVSRALATTRQRLSDRPAERSESPEPEVPAEEHTETLTLKIKEAEERREELVKRARSARPGVDIDYSALKRKPFPHQKEGVHWLLGMLTEALQDDPKDLYRLQGGLLADDMGLGKTFMTLVGVHGYYALQRASAHTEKPILVVAPLSLLENWEDEVHKTFHDAPFRDIVILQTGRDLKTYRAQGAQRESVQLSRLADKTIDDVQAEIRYALNIGPDHGTRRLDRDKRLVITTYQTLRDYQFSLCRVDWGMVVFDEAQHIKNPNVLQTRAAKALKADFKLLATGTPVENSLADFWCLMDTTQPGLLGDWPTFREIWVKPIASASTDDHEQKQQHGQQLRDAVDKFMLRRVKEDQLKDLPTKRIYTGIHVDNDSQHHYLPALATTMQGQQLATYDEVLHRYHKQRVDTEDGRGASLKALQALRQISLYPSQNKTLSTVSGSKQARQAMQASSKMASLVTELDRIRDLSEADGRKAIIFLISKHLQQQLKLWLDAVYGLDISIINGDTQSVTKASNKESLTRKKMIANFEAKTGFNVIIMSPVAAGTGLTVVEANHVFHLERHWNPAKEAQATDRVYRIGQTRDVHIYLPTALHPTHDSFDVHMDRLLRSKLQLKDAVVVPEVVSESEMFRAVGLE